MKHPNDLHTKTPVSTLLEIRAPMKGSNSSTSGRDVPH
jgi:hypothetical protein